MAYVKVERWGRNLAIRIPHRIARATGLTNGERVEIETYAGSIVVRRAASSARADALAAADEILFERGKHPLDAATLRGLIEAGRRG